MDILFLLLKGISEYLKERQLTREISNGIKESKK